MCFVCVSYMGFLQSWPYASVAEFDVINLALAFPGPTFVEAPLRRYIASARIAGVFSRGY